MDMVMGSSSSMSSSMMSMTPTSAAGMSSSTGKPMGGMGGMDMGGGACKISMLWNWYTVDACFIARSWHITSHGMFAGSCIGVICLVIILEFLRRVQREYQKFIYPKSSHTLRVSNGRSAETGDSSSAEHSPDSGSSTEHGKSAMTVTQRGFTGRRVRIVRPTVLQQAVKATIHMLQFAVAYFVMLLAMYYNGYIIICILIGAWIGSFVFSWDELAAQGQGDATEVTGCCG